jgi:hypothetical protein
MPPVTSALSTWCVVLFVASVSVATPQQADQSGSSGTPRISVVAFTPARGDWRVDIEKYEARILVREPQGSRRLSRRLTQAELDRLASLIASVPQTKKTSSFGKTAADITPTFGLTIGDGRDERTYNVGWYLEDTDDGPALTPVLEVMGFIHSLIKSRHAVTPPLDWRRRKQ